MRSALLRSTLPLLLGLTLAGGAAAEQAGVAGAVNLDVTGTPPGAGERPVGIGAQILRDEQVVTTDTGLAQILFLDQTTLTVGPNSDILIDEFVYDPASAEGKLLMEATVGIFRLIGGGVAASGGVDVTTPFASIGIRGSNVVIEIAPDGTTRVTCNYCEEVVVQSRINPGQRYVISGSDRFRTVEIGPAEISDPFALPPLDVARIQDALTSKPGQSGGVTHPPTVEQTEARTVTVDNSDLPAGGLVPGAPPAVEVAEQAPGLIESPAADTATTEASQENLRDDAVEQDNGGGGGGGATELAVTGRWVSSEEDPAQGWLGDKNDPSYTQTFDGATLQDGVITIPLSDDGSVTLPFVPGESLTFGSDGTASPAGPVSGRGFVTPDGSFFYYDLVETDFPNKRAIVFGGTPVDVASQYAPIMAFDIAQDPTLNSPVPFTRQEMLGGMDPGSVTTSPLYFVADGNAAGTGNGQYGVASLGIQGEGPEQTTVFAVSILTGSGSTNPTLQGQVRAISSVPGIGTLVGEFAQPRLSSGALELVPDGNGNSVFGGEEGVYFVVSASGWTSPTPDETLLEEDIYRDSVTPYTPIQQVSVDRDALPAGLGDERPDLTHRGFAAGVAVNTDYGVYYTVAGGMTLTLDGATGTGQVSMQLETPSWDAGFGELDLTFGKTVYVDRQHIMMQELGPSTMDGEDSLADYGALASWQLVQLPGNQLPGGVTPCDCAFMEWGFWAYDRYQDTGGSEPIVRRDTVTIGSWVAGSAVEAESDLPISGTAVYNGHALAHIVADNGGTLTSYTAAGALSTTVDFSSRSMAGTISQLDGRDYAFDSGESRAFAPGFSMSGVSSDEAVMIELNGAFFASPTSNSAGMGGNLTLEEVEGGEMYRGQGTFAAECTSGC